MLCLVVLEDNVAFCCTFPCIWYFDTHSWHPQAPWTCDYIYILISVSFHRWWMWIYISWGELAFPWLLHAYIISLTDKFCTLLDTEVCKILALLGQKTIVRPVSYVTRIYINFGSEPDTLPLSDERIVNPGCCKKVPGLLLGSLLRTRIRHICIKHTVYWLLNRRNGTYRWPV